MKRKSIVAKMLALSLVLSGLPMTSLQAAQLPVTAEAQESGADEIPEGILEPDADNMEAAPTENVDSAEQENEQQDAPAESEAGEKEEEAVPGTDESEQNISGEDGKSDEADEDTGKARNFDMSENARMAGSDGVIYDDVVYLSARNVMAMDEEMQDLYRDLCDEVAASRESGLELQDVVFAVDANGDLHYSYYVPSIVLEEIQADLLPETDGVLEPDAVEEEKRAGETSDDGKDSAEEEKKDSETSDSAVDSEEEKKDGETSDDAVDSEEEKKDGETSDSAVDSEEEKKDGETSDDAADSEEEKKDGETSDDAADSEEEKKDGETSDDGKDSAEEEKTDDETSGDGKDAVEKENQEEGTTDPDQDTEEEAEQEPEEEELVIFEENMDELANPQEETFEVAEPVRIEHTLDLGYGGGSSDEMSRTGKTFYSIFPTEDYFVKQLSASQKKYYNAAKAKLTKGSNKFTFTESLSAQDKATDDVAHAVSALILAYPDKTDWMAKPGGFKGQVLYRQGASVGNYTFTFDKSQFYSGALDSEANMQVLTVGNQAIQYAAENYPDVPVYGIVKYFDQWVCENGYYEMLGTAPLTGEAAVDKLITGLNDSQLQILYEIYYKCHSTYGILLEGYGVCESYAKTMSRLFDAVGIPNFYVVGNAGAGENVGGHAWNYVQMPNGQWYMVDSTWNDTDKEDHITSDGAYLLVKSDGMHFASGCNYNGEDILFGNFQFEPLAAADYIPDSTTESVSLNKTECNLAPRGKETLVGTINGKGGYSDAQGIWTSSNAKVAKVDQKGAVTAVAAGTAEITFAAAGMSAKCTVNVDQIKAFKVKATGKTSETVSLGIDGANMDSKEIVLKVDMAPGSPHDAAWMIQNQKAEQPAVSCSKDGVAEAAVAAVAGNEITVSVKAKGEGSTEVRVKFAGKTVKIKTSAGKIIAKDMFDITWPEAVKGEEGNRTTPYTGKAIKPTIKKKTDAVYKPVTFKVSYINNKDAGEAKAVIMGTGKYGGMIELPYTITPIDISTADFSKTLKSKVYNGGSNPPAATVKLGSKTLKAGKDYEILYTGAGVEKQPLSVVPAGTYTITINGTGNYTGEVKTTQTYQVTTNTIAKVSVAGSASAKYTGAAQNPFTVKIGKNILPDTDYTITWYSGQGNTKSNTALKGSPVVKGKYTAVVTVKGNNLTTTPAKTEIEKKFTIK